MKLYYSEIKSSILDVKVDKRNDVYNWGGDNAYPSTMEYLLGASVTAKSCVDMSSKAVSGAGIKDGHIIINKKGHSVNDVIRGFSREYVKHNNAFLSVGYNALGEVASLEVIPCKNVRVGQRDDSGYNGKYVVYSNWDGKDGKINPDAFQLVDRYNPNKEVVLSQIEHAGGIAKYKGQIVHLQKYMNEIYSQADGDCVLLDMIAEISASEFKMKGATDGFLNVKVMAVKPFNTPQEREAFKRDLDSIKGAKNANSVILLEAPEASSDLKDQMLLQDLTSSHNDKLFQYTEDSVERAICKAFSVNPALLAGSQVMFDSGEKYEALDNILWKGREEERLKIEEILTSTLNNYKNPIPGRVNILRNLSDVDNTTQANPEPINE